MGAITIGGLTVATRSCCKQQLGELVYDLKLPLGLGNTASPLRNRRSGQAGRERITVQSHWHLL